MIFVEGRPEAVWLPSRHNLALFRLLAYIRLRRTRRVATDPFILLVADRHQSSFETNVTAAWYAVIGAGLIAAALSAGMAAPLAVLLALIIAPVVIQAAIVVPSLIVFVVRRDRADGRGAAIVSGVVAALYTFASAVLIASGSRARWIGFAFLGSVALELAARSVLPFVNASIERLEAEYGVGT